MRELAAHPGGSDCGFVTCLSASRAVESHPVLGWEVLGAEIGGGFHSWLCNSIQNHAFAKHGIRPGPLGLLSSEADACAVLRMIDEGLGAEPVPWFRGQICQVS